MSNFINLTSIQLSNTLLLFITIRIITGNVGINGFGMVMFASRFSMLVGTVVNYGTSQSGVKDTVFNLNNRESLSLTFSNTLFVRILIFSIYVICLIACCSIHKLSYYYIVAAAPMVLAEVLNPLCFYIGIERIRVFNLTNLAANFFAVAAIFIFIHQPQDAPWVNFILGTANVTTYIGLCLYFIYRFKLKLKLPSRTEILKMIKENFYLTINNISAIMQQSIIIFALEWSGSGLLGAYALCDRFIAQCRSVLNIVSNAVYPNAVNLYKQHREAWAAYRKKSRRLFAGLFFIGGLLIFVLANMIIFVLSKKHNPDAVVMLRIMGFVPVISAFNVYGVLDMLLKNRNIYLFRIAIALVFIGLITAFVAVSINNRLLIGAFTVIIETCAFCMYEYVLRKPLLNNA
ncbi:oligosaccharide flippase family protein [Mucilaginibacter ximonensis]|uniref:Oligosaccharide flippase family protein n=1 Tax=Mucilaginibacter ximonensis TaxID=538021 RepID=A0ABW5YGB8_9SPHI